MLTKPQLEMYLGRSLTTLETTHLKTYLRLARTRLDQLLCMGLCDDSETKTYDGRLGYKLLFIDPITDVSSVKVDGVEVVAADYTLKQWDNRNAKWFNLIQFKDEMTGDVEVTGSWGFDEFPDDLAMLLAQLFNQNSIEQVTKAQVKSKKIEDFTVTYGEPMTGTQLLERNASVISKYSICRSGDIRHGEVDGYFLTLS